MSCVTFTACSDDDDDYAPGTPAGENNVTFVSYSNPILSKSATKLDIQLNRHAVNGELTVPVEKLNVPEGWTVPESVKFAAGDSLVTLSVGLPSDMKLNTGYTFAIRVPESYTNSYKANNGEVNTYKALVIKEDYETFATGTFEDPYFFEGSWPVTIDYSPALGIYRVKDLFGEATGTSGYNFYFAWNGKSDATQTFTMVSSTGEKMTKMLIGYNDQKYGAVSATWVAGTNDPSKLTDDNSALFGGYVSSEKAFYLPLDFTVSAGDFGIGNEKISNVTFVK